jgi:hypothetical protein
VWRPYLHWASQLDINDVIVTFNYDRVLETMMGGPIVDAGGQGFTLINDEGRVDYARAAKTARILKLHGSVSWRANLGGGHWGFAETNDPEFAVRCDPTEMSIGTPGRAKHQATSQFQGLWSIAVRELAEASRVYIIGYSFPDSDSDPAMAILDAFRKNPMEREVRVVVGNDSTTQERIRYHFRNAARVEVEPATAQRFFQSWTRD